MTVATLKAVEIDPDRATLKAATVRVSMFVASRLRMVQVSNGRFVQVIMIDGVPRDVERQFVDTRMKYWKDCSLLL